MQYIAKMASKAANKSPKAPTLHTAVETRSWPRQCSFRQSHNRIDRPSLVLPLLPSPPLPTQNFSSALYAVSESGWLAVSGLPRCLCSAISVIVCQIGAVGEHNRLPTLVHLCRPWHLYRLSWPPVSVPAPLCFIFHSAVVVFYTFLRPTRLLFRSPPALASPSDICVCLASGHQLELDFNTATDRHTLLNCQQVWKTDVKGSSVTSVIPPPIIFLPFLHFFHPWQSHYHICIFQARISPTEGREQKVQFELFKLPTNSRIFVYTSTQKAKLGTRQLY